jgi:predicted dehydrogenase
MIRRDFLKQIGLVTAGLAITDPFAMAKSMAGMSAEELAKLPPEELIHFPLRSLRPDTGGKRITGIIVGAGNRGRLYASYAERYPENFKIVGVAEPIEGRRDAMIKKHGIPMENAFVGFKELLEQPKLADVVVIATPDDLHYEPCMKALELGYDVLLEKPIAQTEKECRDILRQTEKYNRIVAVCHVLRYAPYFIALREYIRSGAIGEVVNIQHMEPIEFAHMAHSYVRGKWRVEKETTPIILAKSCHDLDIVRWLIDKPCKVISAEGSLHLFKKENMPEGAPFRCTDGCPYEAECPFSAMDVYLRRKKHLGVFDLKNRNDDAEILEKLHTTGYGRCVFQCDNDQPDHYVTTMLFEEDKTATFTMDAFTPWGGRRTRVMGTKGYIEGDMSIFTAWDFKTGKTKIWSSEIEESEEYKGSGHGGGDFALVRDFLEAVAAQDQSKLSSTLAASVESHVMGFAAEKSRKSMRKARVKMRE